MRLKAVDAPETRQSCGRPDGSEYPCGKLATAAPRVRIGTSRVECETMERGRYGRHLAICRNPGMAISLNEWLVLNGHVLAYRHFDKRYVAQENSARAAMIGIWQGHFQAPWNWYKERRAKRNGR